MSKVYIVWGFDEYDDELKYEHNLDGDTYIESIYDNKKGAEKEAARLNKKFHLNEETDEIFYVEPMPLKSEKNKTLGMMLTENKQLKEQLQQRDSVIEEAIKLIDDACYIDGTKMPNGLGNKNVRKLLDILNKYKKEESE